MECGVCVLNCCQFQIHHGMTGPSSCPRLITKQTLMSVVFFSVVSWRNFNLPKTISHDQDDSDEDDDERNNDNRNNNVRQSRKVEDEGSDWFVCNVCKKVFRAKKALLLHKKSEHRQQQQSASSLPTKTTTVKTGNATSSSSMSSPNYK